jgi:hypothetical protein
MQVNISGQSERPFGSTMHIPAVATNGAQGVIERGTSCKGPSDIRAESHFKMCPAQRGLKRCAPPISSHATVATSKHWISILTPNNPKIMKESQSMEMTSCGGKHQSRSGVLAIRQKHAVCFSHGITFRANLRPCGTLHRTCTYVVPSGVWRQHRGPSFCTSQLVWPLPVSAAPRNPMCFPRNAVA